MTRWLGMDLVCLLACSIAIFELAQCTSLAHHQWSLCVCRLAGPPGGQKYDVHLKFTVGATNTTQLPSCKPRYAYTCSHVHFPDMSQLPNFIALDNYSLHKDVYSNLVTQNRLWVTTVSILNTAPPGHESVLSQNETLITCLLSPCSNLPSFHLLPISCTQLYLCCSYCTQWNLASSPGHSQILSCSYGEKSGESLGSLLRHGPEMVDSVSSNWVHITY